MDLGIAGKWALVCAASKGLGKGCAAALVREGVNVVVTARGAEALDAAATELRDRSLQVYQAAADLALERGLILADTKFEFGVDPVTDELTLADEVLTSDSSRYWDANVYATAATAAERMASFDKQVVRNWLAANWDKQGEAPRLPDEIVAKTTARYQELIDRLVG